eukprot:1157831-Pelagomonas_calceolata.AAC.4
MPDKSKASAERTHCHAPRKLAHSTKAHCIVAICAAAAAAAAAAAQCITCLDPTHAHERLQNISLSTSINIEQGKSQASSSGQPALHSLAGLARCGSPAGLLLPSRPLGRLGGLSTGPRSTQQVSIAQASMPQVQMLTGEGHIMNELQGLAAELGCAICAAHDAEFLQQRGYNAWSPAQRYFVEGDHVVAAEANRTLQFTGLDSGLVSSGHACFVFMAPPRSPATHCSAVPTHHMSLCKFTYSSFTRCHAGSFYPFFIYTVVATTIASVFTVVPFLVAPARVDLDKSSAYECGFDAFGDSRQQFSVSFYLVAIMYLLFDIEVCGCGCAHACVHTHAFLFYPLNPFKVSMSMDLFVP